MGRDGKMDVSNEGFAGRLEVIVNGGRFLYQGGGVKMYHAAVGGLST